MVTKAEGYPPQESGLDITSFVRDLERWTVDPVFLVEHQTLIGQALRRTGGVFLRVPSEQQGGEPTRLAVYVTEYLGNGHERPGVTPPVGFKTLRMWFSEPDGTGGYDVSELRTPFDFKRPNVTGLTRTHCTVGKPLLIDGTARSTFVYGPVEAVWGLQRGYSDGVPKPEFLFLLPEIASALHRAELDPDAYRLVVGQVAQDYGQFIDVGGSGAWNQSMPDFLGQTVSGLVFQAVTLQQYEYQN